VAETHLKLLIILSVGVEHHTDDLISNVNF